MSYNSFFNNFSKFYVIYTTCDWYLFLCDKEMKLCYKTFYSIFQITLYYSSSYDLEAWFWLPRYRRVTVALSSRYCCVPNFCSVLEFRLSVHQSNHRRHIVHHSWARNLKNRLLNNRPINPNIRTQTNIRPIIPNTRNQTNIRSIIPNIRFSCRIFDRLFIFIF